MKTPMIRAYQNAICFAVMSAFVLPAYAGNISCDPGEPGMLNELSAKTKEITKAAEEAQPKFMFACHDPESLKGRPEATSHLLITRYGDLRKNKSLNFLKEVAGYVSNEIEGTLSIVDGFTTCLDPQQKGRIDKNHSSCRQNIRSSSCDATLYEDCSFIREWSNGELKSIVSNARLNLALSQGGREFVSISGRAKHDVNRDLESLGSAKKEDWVVLTHDEERTASAILNQTKTEIKSEFNRRVANGKERKRDFMKFYEESLMVTRNEYFNEYQRTLGTFPILQFIKSPSPSTADVFEAAKKMKEGLIKEKKELQKRIKMLKRAESSRANIDSEVLDLLNYRRQVETILKAEPEFCGHATAMVEYVEKREVVNKVAVGLPLLVASMAFPPAAGALIGIAGSGAFYLHSHNKFQARANKSLVTWSRDDTPDFAAAEAAEVSDAKFESDFEKWMFPMAFVGTGVVKWAVVKSGSAVVGRSVAKSATKLMPDVQKPTTSFQAWAKKKSRSSAR